MKKSLFCAAAICCAMMLAACSDGTSNVPEFDYEALNAQALEEYLVPVHPGIRGQRPFWNTFSIKYIYAPIFDFDDVEGADGYTYTAEADGKFFIFGDKSPRSALSEIWAELPVGPVSLSVQAYDAEGEHLGEPQTVSFEKDNPFSGPYDPAPIGYKEAAIRIAKFQHDSGIGQSWAAGSEPDMTYRYNCYACKIWSAIAQTECFLAREVPEYRDSALVIARNVCDGIISHSQGPDAPLAYFPPTYYYAQQGGGVTGVLNYNQGNTMFLEAVFAARALLDFYDICGEQKYFDHALGIARTYQKLQAEDGSWPVKVKYDTAESVVSARCMPCNILHLANRLKVQYGVCGFEEMTARAEDWLWENPLKTYDFSGQFEDVSVEDKVPYQNLTHCVVGDCIDYLLGKPEPDQEELKASIEMARFCEDQFVRWHSSVERDADALSATEGVFSSPFAFEQYVWQNPVDASIAKLADDWLHIYVRTGDMLSLAKAKAMADTLVKIQDPETGSMPTIPDSDRRFEINEIWANCAYYSISTLMWIDSILSGE